VLLVDDSPVMLATLARILEKEKRTTLIGSAADGWLALRAALRSPPDLVLLDLHLPHLDGTEVTRYLKLLPNPPIVFIITSDDSLSAQTTSEAVGADAFVVKGSDLEAQIRSKLQQWFWGATEA
jgi:two-component system, OmpR family, response regulator ChvI